jgi:hypothetical protein
VTTEETEPNGFSTNLRENNARVMFAWQLSKFGPMRHQQSVISPSLRHTGLCWVISYQFIDDRQLISVSFFFINGLRVYGDHYIPNLKEKWFKGTI